MKQRITAVGNAYYLDTPINQIPSYWQMEISRLSLPVGGGLDSFVYWGIPYAESHIDGWQLDVRNPNDSAKARSLLKHFNAQQCLVSNTSTVFWHVQC